VHNFGLLETVMKVPLLPPHQQPANSLTGVWAVHPDKYRITLVILQILLPYDIVNPLPFVTNRHKTSTTSPPRA